MEAGLCHARWLNEIPRKSTELSLRAQQEGNSYQPARAIGSFSYLETPVPSGAFHSDATAQYAGCPFRQAREGFFVVEATAYASVSARANAGAWALILRMAMTMSSMSLGGPRSSFCESHTASSQSLSFSGQALRWAHPLAQEQGGLELGHARVGRSASLVGEVVAGVLSFAAVVAVLYSRFGGIRFVPPTPVAKVPPVSSSTSVAARCYRSACTAGRAWQWGPR